MDDAITINQIDYLAEIIIVRKTVIFRVGLGRPVLSLVVWILKREVRAFGGCLGMYRR